MFSIYVYIYIYISSMTSGPGGNWQESDYHRASRAASGTASLSHWCDAAKKHKYDD